MNKKPTKTAKGFAIEVSGQYHSLDQVNGNKTPKIFKPEKFIFPEVVEYKDGLKEITVLQEDGSERKTFVPNIVKAHILNVALHIIKTYHIGPRLRERYPDFNGIRLCSIFSKEEVEMDELDAIPLMKKKIKEMNESDLLQYVTIRDIPVTISNYPDLADKKMAVEQAVQQKEMDDEAAGKARPLSEEEKLLVKPSLLS